MEWNQQEVAAVIQTARLKQGLTLNDVSVEAGVKASVVSSLEKGRHSRPPNKGTQAKLEKALGIILPIPRGTQTKVSVYVPTAEYRLIDEAMTRFPALERSSAIMAALKEWSTHRAAVDKWNEEHPTGKI